MMISDGFVAMLRVRGLCNGTRLIDAYSIRIAAIRHWTTTTSQGRHMIQSKLLDDRTNTDSPFVVDRLERRATLIR